MIALEITTFLGRFHPLFVHLPIGFLILAIALEWYKRFTKKDLDSSLIPFAWLLGALSALGAAVTGWYLGETGLYEEELLFSHRWLGIALIFIALAGWWIKRKPQTIPTWVHHTFNVVLLVLLSIEGHKGGNLTHGETYLTEYAPDPLKRILQKDATDNTKLLSLNTDSVRVYADLIEPIFKEKCFACHNDDIKRGGLNMSHPDSMMQIGNNEVVIKGGNVGQSELFRRITLPQSSAKFMPPTNNVLSYDEIKTVEWWIDQGADFDGRLSQLNISDDMSAIFLRTYGIDTSPKPYYEKVSIQPADSLAIVDISKKGFTIKSLGGDNNLLDVKYSGNELSSELINSLEPIKDHITWLSLGNTNISNEMLSEVGKFKNLTRLQLEKTAVGDAGVTQLKNLNHLEALNLYNNEGITDSSIEILKQMSGLKRVYLWGTQVSKEKAKELSEINENIDVILGEN